jgi:hypothetical protein
MKCSICQGEIKSKSITRLFNKDICGLCIYSIGQIHVNHILFDYYKDRIKDLQRKAIIDVL